VKRFKRVYIEITNVCNLNCSFCPKTKRTPKSLSIAEFEHIIKEVKNVTNHIYFHVMGEPLLHKNLDEFLKIASNNGLNVNLTTNGTFIKNVEEILLENKPRKISFSLHSFEGNGGKENLKTYLNDIIEFSLKALPLNIIIEFRLWNNGKNALNNTQNNKIIAILQQKFANNVSFLENTLKEVGGVTLQKNCYLGFENVFTWPDESLNLNNQTVYCLGLKDQIAILVDGTVVPCCLDNNGSITLGNIFKNSIEEIISTDFAKSILLGFQNKKAVCDLCKNCGYAKQKFKL